ncbi:hypothetical protein E1176_04525 [Fulvivirga sp. RKSG066]|uniref:hypothetical protein n=1 Tax=Fulvivirga aurantia TaxID=2529383 RepID=UPI0012BCB581|nr:hypothetical protein [Fulvivirga aurantia]MTI20278.1 hypothetical protein [Fulvivirga aurantia]
MRSTITTLLVFFSIGAISQTIEYENLNQFDKLVIDGKVTSLHTKKSHHDKSEMMVKGVEKEYITTRIEAGVLYLNIENDHEADVTVYNSSLKRIEADEPLEIVGAQYVGSNGKYLLTDFSHHHGDCSDHVAVNIPTIDIDIPGLSIDIPEMNFDFEHHFDHDFDIDIDIDEDSYSFNWNWEEQSEELRHVSKEMKEEMQKAMKEMKKELKKYRKE